MGLLLNSLRKYFIGISEGLEKGTGVALILLKVWNKIEETM
jgi:hypothetical protein